MEDEEFNDGQGEKQRMSDGGWRGSARFMMTAHSYAMGNRMSLRGSRGDLN